MADNDVTLRMAHDDAVVLFDFLSRIHESGKLSLDHAAESAALDNLLCALERTLVEPFSSGWDELLRAARSRVAPEREG